MKVELRGGEGGSAKPPQPSKERKKIKKQNEAVKADLFCAILKKKDTFNGKE